MQETLKDRVKEVALSAGLVDAPARVVGEDFDCEPHLEKLQRDKVRRCLEQEELLNSTRNTS